MAEISSVWIDDYSGVAETLTYSAAATAATFDASDRNLLMVKNTSTNTTYTATITSVANRQGRTEDITITLAGSAEYAMHLRSHGWVTTGGKITVLGSNAAVEFALANMRD